MKYWLDTEFIERPFTIDLISIGLVAEDGREFYAESSEVDWSKASQWTCRRCARNSTGLVCRARRLATPFAGSWIRMSTRCSGGTSLPSIGSCSAGCSANMHEQPFHFPALCLDIKQWAIELGDPEFPAS